MKEFVKRTLDFVFNTGVMGRHYEERIKFFLRWELFWAFGRVTLFFFGSKVNRSGWEDRILIIGPGGIGDVIMATPALRAYRTYFPDKKIYLIVTEHGGMTKSMFGDFIDEILTVDGQRFPTNLSYQINFINSLRRIGFAEVINEALGLADLTSKTIAISVGARDVIGYQGRGIDFASWQSKNFMRFSKKNIFPLYTKLVNSIDERTTANYHPRSSIVHHLEFCRAVTGVGATDPSTFFFIDETSRKSAFDKLKKLGSENNRYAVFVISCVDPARRWEIDKFAAVADYVHNLNLEIVLIGTPSQRYWSEIFANYFDKFINAVGVFSLAESAAIIKNAYCVVSNDTGPVHMAIALGTPSVCITPAGHLGMNSLYGREEINRWIYKDIGCLYDDAQCTETVPLGAPAPCLSAVSVDDVVAEIDSLSKHMAEHVESKERFVAEYNNETS